MRYTVSMQFSEILTLQQISVLYALPQCNNVSYQSPGVIQSMQKGISDQTVVLHAV